MILTSWLNLTVTCGGTHPADDPSETHTYGKKNIACMILCYSRPHTRSDTLVSPCSNIPSRQACAPESSWLPSQLVPVPEDQGRLFGVRVPRNSSEKLCVLLSRHLRLVHLLLKDRERTLESVDDVHVNSIFFVICSLTELAAVSSSANDAI